MMMMMITMFMLYNNFHFLTEDYKLQYQTLRSFKVHTNDRQLAENLYSFVSQWLAKDATVHLQVDVITAIVSLLPELDFV